MNKQVYIQPAINIATIAPQQLIAASRLGIYSDTTVNDESGLAKGRDGQDEDAGASWGNMW